MFWTAVPIHPECCSISSGTPFQLSWNRVPTQLEQGSNLTVTKRDVKKLTTKAYRVGNERWRLGGGKVSSWWRQAVERTPQIEPSQCQTLRKFGIRCDAFFSKIRKNTTGYLTNQRHAIVDITIEFYPELVQFLIPNTRLVAQKFSSRQLLQFRQRANSSTITAIIAAFIASNRTLLPMNTLHCGSKCVQRAKMLWCSSRVNHVAYMVLWCVN